MPSQRGEFDIDELLAENDTLLEKVNNEAIRFHQSLLWMKKPQANNRVE
uniref:Uncharacterized protein n=1 Tax=Nelumbo nucifera TaxID=4432 RepID=A0A822XTS7_NELNU|nr:TPA_asm: hypothetical protein HUJ06_025253 [Nelumbo nucifera]